MANNSKGGAAPRGPALDENDEGTAGSTPLGSPAGDPSGGMLSGAMTMSGINDENIAAEAAALGVTEGALADDQAKGK